jgi:hypothetical protein
LAFVFQVCRNRFRCHGQSVAEPATSKLCTLALCQRAAISGLVEIGSAGTNRPIRMRSFFKTI